MMTKSSRFRFVAGCFQEVLRGGGAAVAAASLQLQVASLPPASGEPSSVSPLLEGRGADEKRSGADGDAAAAAATTPWSRGGRFKFGPASTAKAPTPVRQRLSRLLMTDTHVPAKPMAIMCSKLIPENAHFVLLPSPIFASRRPSIASHLGGGRGMGTTGEPR
jgi:hypothetical protein